MGSVRIKLTIFFSFYESFFFEYNKCWHRLSDGMHFPLSISYMNPSSLNTINVHYIYRLSDLMECTIPSRSIQKPPLPSRNTYTISQLYIKYIYIYIYVPSYVPMLMLFVSIQQCNQCCAMLVLNEWKSNRKVCSL